MAFDPSRVLNPRPVPEDLICIICTGVLLDPVEGPCEHLACRECLHDWLSRSTNCPVCRQTLEKTQVKQAHRLARNQLDALEVTCDNAARGCKAVLALGALKTHLSVCGKVALGCNYTGCSATILREDLLLHLQACPHRTVSCKLCDRNIEFQEQQEHLRKDCPNMELPCDHNGGCGQRVMRYAVPAHIDNECSRALVPCAILGCKKEVARGDMQNHLEKSLVQHMASMSIAYSAQLQHANDEIATLRAEVAQLRSRKVGLFDAQCVATLAGHSKAVVSLAASEGVLYSGALDDNIRAWNLDSFACAKVLTVGGAGETMCAVSAEHGLLCCLLQFTKPTGRYTFHVWTTRDYEPQSGADPGAASTAIIGKGRLYCLQDIKTHCATTSAQPWVKRAGQKTTTATGPAPHRLCFAGEEAVFGPYTYSGPHVSLIFALDANNMQCLGQMDATGEHITDFTAMAEEDGMLYTLTDVALMRWSTVSWSRLPVVPPPGRRWSGFAGSLAVGGGFLYVGAKDNTIKVLDTTTLQWMDSPLGHNSPVKSLLLHEGCLYSGSEDGEIKVWLLPKSE